MDAVRWKRVEGLFQSALDLPPDEHARVVAEAAQPAVELVRGAAGAAGGVRLADVQDVQRHERQS